MLIKSNLQWAQHRQYNKVILKCFVFSRSSITYPSLPQGGSVSLPVTTRRILKTGLTASLNLKLPITEAQRAAVCVSTLVHATYRVPKYTFYWKRHFLGSGVFMNSLRVCHTLLAGVKWVFKTHPARLCCYISSNSLLRLPSFAPACICRTPQQIARSQRVTADAALLTACKPQIRVQPPWLAGSPAQV